MLATLARRVRPRIGFRRAFIPNPPEPIRGECNYAKGNDMAAKKKAAKKKAAKKPAKRTAKR